MTSTHSRTTTWTDPRASAKLGLSMAGLDFMRAYLTGEIPKPPIAVTRIPREHEHAQQAVF